MVYHDTAELLRVPAVRAAFGLDALVEEGTCAAGEFADTLPPPQARVLPLQPLPQEGDAIPTARRMRCG
jgi:NitT/TauT family transport system ATP-binding protein